MNVAVRFVKQIAFALAGDYCNTCLSRDNRRLREDFLGILNNSKQFVYLCQTSPEPLLLRDEFRDLMLSRICEKKPGLDIKVLIRAELFRFLNYYDASFRTTKKRIGDFVIGDAGTLIICPHDWNLFKAREAYPGEDLKGRFLSAYNTAEP